jgi:hypothetical protein
MEIGIGLGFVSVYCAKIVGSENVYTFEANPLNVEMALRVFRKNKVSPRIQNAFFTESSGTNDFPIKRTSLLGSSASILVEDKLNEIFYRLKENGFVADSVMPGGRNYFFKRVQA